MDDLIRMRPGLRAGPPPKPLTPAEERRVRERTQPIPGSQEAIDKANADEEARRLHKASQERPGVVIDDSTGEEALAPAKDAETPAKPRRSRKRKAAAKKPAETAEDE
jgi:hypothetical protein